MNSREEMARLDKRVEVGVEADHATKSEHSAENSAWTRWKYLWKERQGGERDEPRTRESTCSVNSRGEEKTPTHGREAPVDVFLGEAKWATTSSQVRGLDHLYEEVRAGWRGARCKATLTLSFARRLPCCCLLCPLILLLGEKGSSVAFRN